MSRSQATHWIQAPAGWSWPDLLGDFLIRFGENPGSVVLESQLSRPGCARWSLLAALPGITCEATSEEIVLTDSGGGTRETARPTRENLERLLALAGLFDSRISELPPPRPWLGYIGYEAGHWLAEMPIPLGADSSDMPDLWLARHQALLLWDHEREEAWLSGDAAAHVWPARWQPPMPEFGRGFDSGIDDGGAESDFAAITMPADYGDAIERVREYILAGDIFQANYTRRFDHPSTATPVEVFRTLRAQNPASHAALLVLDDARAVVSASPEVYLRRRSTDGRLETRPIKGTLEQGRQDSPDAAAAALLASPKDRAEHVMIVDVKRNDLGRIAERGSVRVESLLEPLRVPNMYHLESTISAKPKGNVGAIDCVAALFPGGSISGAPKIRACEIIREIEASRRNVYTGCIGWIDTSSLNLSIAIRTLYRPRVGLWVSHAGGGIVADSVAEAEWRECLAKNAALARAVRAAENQQPQFPLRTITA